MGGYTMEFISYAWENIYVHGYTILIGGEVSFIILVVVDAFDSGDLSLV